MINLSYSLRLCIKDLFYWENFEKSFLMEKVEKFNPAIPDQEVSCAIIFEDDAVEVLAFLKRTFFKDEPLNCFLELGVCQDLEVYCTKSISDGCSFKAVNSAGEIIGVFLSGIIHKPPSDAENCSLASKTDHEKFKKIMGLMDYIDSKFNIFELYPDIDCFVDGKILSVDPKYRGLKIPDHLTNKTIEFMKHNRIQIFQVSCSSHFAARVFEKKGFSEVFALPYSAFLDENGDQVLKPEKPHLAQRIFTYKVYD